MFIDYSAFDAHDEGLFHDIAVDRRNGLGLIESLEKRAMLSVDAEVAETPWEIEEPAKPPKAAEPVAPVYAKPREYIGTEIDRNKAHAGLFIAMVRMAYGKDDVTVVGHHIAFEIGDDFNTLNEIPSADSLIFDHVIMQAVFGARAIEIMQRLAALPYEQRDVELLRVFLAAGHKVASPAVTQSNAAP